MRGETFNRSMIERSLMASRTSGSRAETVHDDLLPLVTRVSGAQQEASRRILLMSLLVLLIMMMLLYAYEPGKEIPIALWPLPDLVDHRQYQFHPGGFLGLGVDFFIFLHSDKRCTLAKSGSLCDKQRLAKHITNRYVLSWFPC